MDLSTISKFFDQFRNTGSGILRSARERNTGSGILRSARERIGDTFGSSGLGKFIRYSDISQEEFNPCLKVLLGEELYECLTQEQVVEVLQQLSGSLKKVDEETTVACWRYWLREDTKPVPALILVDVQNDFIDGSLALKNCPAGQDGGEVVPIINGLLSKKLFTEVVYLKDWHPSDHISFIENIKLHPIHHSSQIDAEHAKVLDTVKFDFVPVIEQKLWPRHCEMNSPGAELHKDLQSPKETDIVVTKGSSHNVDSYSGFWDNSDLSHTKLFTKLVERGVTHVFVCGLALDVCVKLTAVHAIEHGFRTFVLEDACRAVSNEGIALTMETFKEIGISLFKTSEVPEKLKALVTKRTEFNGKDKAKTCCIRD